ncbi:hypothetical protein HDU67_008803 [Dinochytrium kinnereticum]|nr:hypothetical protein HDU67_008803 [Dinochytrium kinnereticum]
MEVVSRSFPYMVDTKNATGGGAVPSLQFIVFDEDRKGEHIDPFFIEELNVIPFEVEHGKYSDGRPYMCMGFRFDNFTYISDVSAIPPRARRIIEGTGVLVIDSLKEEMHASHFGIPQATELCLDLKPSNAYYIGFSHRVDHDTLLAELSEDERLKKAGLDTDTILFYSVKAEPAYDGLRINLSSAA